MNQDPQDSRTEDNYRWQLMMLAFAVEGSLLAMAYVTGFVHRTTLLGRDGT